ncbi:hypothetical protein WJX81_005117 [Elliptochloris bilobata]|uniref:BZIP domain-containing protein n=1 Tax=Elliptochloris bilobata TaxID=381761 RepID=A0AAW1SC73_9CHLO
MNMDEFLSTVWDRADPAALGGLAAVDEQAELPAPRGPTPPPEGAPASHSDYSGKTVEEVWQLIHGTGARGPETQTSLASVTLGSFLQSAGLGSLALDLPDIPELQGLPSRGPLSPLCVDGALLAPASALPTRDAAALAAAPAAPGTSVAPQAGPSTTRPSSAASDLQRQASRQLLTRSERADALVPPPPPVPRGGRQRKRKDPDVVDERTARLQKRMVKNRESAARSRARKQQYTTELETQVEELKSINRELLEQVISHCPPPLPTHSPALGGEPLRRTRTMPL